MGFRRRGTFVASLAFLVLAAAGEGMAEVNPYSAVQSQLARQQIELGAGLEIALKKATDEAAALADVAPAVLAEKWATAAREARKNFREESLLASCEAVLAAVQPGEQAAFTVACAKADAQLAAGIEEAIGAQQARLAGLAAELLDGAAVGKEVATANDAVAEATREGLSVRTALLAGVLAEAEGLSEVVAKARQSALREALDQLGVTEESKLVRCVWAPAVTQRISEAGTPPGLSCTPDALRVSGEEIGLIEILDLPMGARVTAVVASTRLRGAESDFGADQLGLTRENFADAIVVHRNRLYGPTFLVEGCGSRSTLEARKCAVQRLRAPVARTLHLAVDNTATAIEVRVTHAEQEARQTIPLTYERWKIEVASFFAVSQLTDHRLVIVPDPADASKSRAVAIEDVDDFTTQTGVYLGLVPKNYEGFALGVGFHTSAERSPAIYFGPSVRLRGLGESALASFSLGILGSPVRRFTDIELCPTTGDCPTQARYAANDKALVGELEYHWRPYALLSLGFRFGPVGGGG